MPKHIIYWLFFALVLLVIVASFYVTTSRGKGRFGEGNSYNSSSVIDSPTPSDSLWLSFSSGVHDFTIEYPPEIKVEKLADGSILFSRLGPTQQSNTEFNDGISLMFSSGVLSEKSLKDFVDNQRLVLGDEQVENGIGPTESVRLASKVGYQFQVIGLSKSTYIYLPLGNDRYLRITNSSLDPTSAGFGNTVAQMLESLELGS